MAKEEIEQSTDVKPHIRSEPGSITLGIPDTSPLFTLLIQLCRLLSSFSYKSASNAMKNNSMIDGHIRAQLSYHEGY